VRLLEQILLDVRHSYRAIAKTPVVSAVAILSLALGLGANTAIFSVINALLVRSLPVERPGELALLESAGRDRRTWTNPIWEQIRDRADQFAGALAVSPTRFNLAQRGQSEIVDGLWASGRAFEVLGIPARVGRTLTDADDRPGGGAGGPVAVISHAYWQRRFAGAADTIGRSIVVERVPVTIVGVTPPDFFGVEVGRTFDIALPIGAATLIRGTGILQQRSMWWLRIMVRLKPGQTLDAGTALLQAQQLQILRSTVPNDWHPSQIGNYLKEPFRLEAAATGDSGLRSRYQRPLLTIMTVVGLVLLIACANLANLLLARAATRRQEISLRIALGASRARVAHLLLTESLLLASVGAVLGLVIARWSSALLVRQFSTATNNVYLDLSIDWRVLGFTTAVSIATALIFGIVPALRSTRLAPQDALKAGARTVSGDIAGAAGPTLVIVQVALSLVLLVTAGLFIRTFASLAQLNLGFDSRPVLTASVQIPGARIDSTQGPDLVDQLVSAAESVPGVARVAVSELTPLGNNTWNNLIELPDGPELPEDSRLTYFNRVTPGWFDTFGTRMLAGRDFSRADTIGSPPVAIVNAAFARRFTGGRSPIGVRVKHPNNVVREIVGYVADAAYESVRAAAPPTLYVPYSQDNQVRSAMVVSVRTAGGSPALLTQPLVAALSRVHGDLVVTPRPFADQVGAAVARERIVAVLSAVFGGLALLLAGLGLYGVTAFAVSRRRAEIGMRMALGATSAHVLSQVLGRIIWLVALGVVAGAGVSLWASRFVSPLLYGLSPNDPATFVAASVVLIATAALAAWLPARRATQVDPATVLRDG
jgi:putative ABC transport system permease protein